MNKVVGMNKLYIKPIHIIAELIGFATVFASIVYAVVKAAITKGNIPTHFDFAGNIDGYGSPWVLLVLPVIMLVTLVITSLSIHLMPMNKWNMPFKVNPERANVVYSDSLMAVALLMPEIGIYTLLETLLFAKGKSLLILSILLCVALFATAIICMIKASRDNKSY